MSRLLNPGLGDYADRLSILTLKIDIYGQQALPTAHLCAERMKLVEQQPAVERAFGVDPRGHRLHSVNRRIWEGVELIERLGRMWPRVTSDDVYELAGAAVDLQRLNRERAELVRLISGEDTPKEKL